MGREGYSKWRTIQVQNKMPKNIFRPVLKEVLEVSVQDSETSSPSYTRKKKKEIKLHLLHLREGGGRGAIWLDCRQ